MIGRLTLRPRTGASRLAPETVQASAMDCGPATLKCLVEGFGIRVSYDPLPEACQTDIDGTSIDAIEEAAGELGVAAEQIMIPSDHLLLPEAAALPAIVVVTSAAGATHFVVVWNRIGPWVQVMDPASGRRWSTVEGLLQELYIHATPVPAAAWRESVGSEESTRVLAARMKQLGLGRSAIIDLISTAASSSDWRPFATLDAAVRMGRSLVRSGALRPAPRWSVSSGPAANPASRFRAILVGAPVEGRESEAVELRGAVLVRGTGRRQLDGAEVEDHYERSSELSAALERPSSRPFAWLMRLIRQDGLGLPSVLAAAFVASAILPVIEALLFRGFLDLGIKLVLPEQRLAAIAALVLFLLILIAVDVPLARGSLEMGRRLEARLRMLFSTEAAAQSDRYFRSRLSSDMAERAHSVHRLRDAPESVVSWSACCVRSF